MFADTAYRIRFANAADAEALRRLAEQGPGQPRGRWVLIGEIDGTPAAALALRDGCVLTDSSRNTDGLVAALRRRAAAMQACAAPPPPTSERTGRTAGRRSARRMPRSRLAA